MSLSRLSCRALSAAAVLAFCAGGAMAAPCSDGAVSDLLVEITAENRFSPGSVLGDGRQQVALADVNNDGHDDIILGFAEAGFGDVGENSRRGVVQVFSGVDGSMLYEFTGASAPLPNQSDGFGWRVGAADVNNDGFQDVIVSLRRANGGDGRILIFSGATGQQIRSINGVGGNFGDTILNIGDVNGDNNDDILVTVPGFNPQSQPVPPGAIVVYSGGTGAILDSTVGGGLNPRLGRIAGILGDVNNDGVPEFFANTNQSMIVFPADDLEGGIWIRIIDQFGGSPVAAAAIGDLDNDGAPDLAIVRDGLYSVRSGATGDLILDETRILGAGSIVTMEGIADLNADGLDDFVLTNVGSDAQLEELLYIDAATGETIARVVGPAYFDPDLGPADIGYGTGLAVGDVNNDGSPDVAVARRIEQSSVAPFSETLQAFVYTSLPCAGDVNNDGVVNFADLNAILAAFGETGFGVVGDTDCSAAVNFADLNTALSAFGAKCD